jgi:hypothetical protein
MCMSSSNTSSSSCWIPPQQNSHSAQSTVHRNVNQQQRIHDGLKDGSLSTREAAALQKEQSQIEKKQAEFLKDGTLSASEKDQLNAMQNKASQNIYRARHNGERGNPNSQSTQRAMDSVQRNINQQSRIEKGIENGSLTNEEVADLQNGQSLTTRKQSLAMRDGHMSARELAGINGAQDSQSQNIYDQKHDDETQESERREDQEQTLLQKLLQFLSSIFGGGSVAPQPYEGPMHTMDQTSTGGQLPTPDQQLAYLLGFQNNVNQQTYSTYGGQQYSTGNPDYHGIGIGYGASTR